MLSQLNLYSACITCHGQDHRDTRFLMRSSNLNIRSSVPNCTCGHCFVRYSSNNLNMLEVVVEVIMVVVVVVSNIAM